MYSINDITNQLMTDWNIEKNNRNITRISQKINRTIKELNLWNFALEVKQGKNITRKWSRDITIEIVNHLIPYMKKVAKQLNGPETKDINYQPKDHFNKNEKIEYKIIYQKHNIKPTKRQQLDAMLERFLIDNYKINIDVWQHDKEIVVYKKGSKKEIEKANYRLNNPGQFYVIRKHY